ncbi:MAG TPA: FKBP-type peptidyl-prolyl cis-trans isomerase [Candidatus Pacearchaeota archaeon]|nr:FKBP-type peptidyl-prolyl cis-trans isomerase [Candidatus Pacearchaeota archaeon]
MFIEILKESEINQFADSDDLVSVHYVGTLLDGTEFDSSVKRGVPFEFKLGAGQVIPGWDQGVLGMRVGEIRKLTLAPELAYGNYEVSPLIPTNSTLIFEIELLDL